ncbi:hypothetical protein E1H18_4791 [Caulobacter sp. RHG1]|nr:hypothetical protein [Caulobacter sp. RHG1]
MSRVWRYVLAADNGMAPCVHGGVLSLACCKPGIRKSAQRGDWVIGFMPKSYGRGLVAWAGEVDEVVKLGAYQKSHARRPDAIYRLDGHTTEGAEILTPLRHDYHWDGVSRGRDKRGQNAVLFRRFWYWGGQPVAAPEEIAVLAHYFVGQSSAGSSPEMVDSLSNWLMSVATPGAHGSPRDQRLTRSMSRC